MYFNDESANICVWYQWIGDRHAGQFDLHPPAAVSCWSHGVGYDHPGHYCDWIRWVHEISQICLRKEGYQFLIFRFCRYIGFHFQIFDVSLQVFFIVICSMPVWKDRPALMSLSKIWVFRQTSLYTSRSSRPGLHLVSVFRLTCFHTHAFAFALYTSLSKVVVIQNQIKCQVCLEHQANILILVQRNWHLRWDDKMMRYSFHISCVIFSLFSVIILCIVEVVIILLLIFLRKRLLIAIALIKEASRFVFRTFIAKCVFLGGLVNT